MLGVIGSYLAQWARTIILLRSRRWLRVIYLEDHFRFSHFFVAVPPLFVATSDYFSGSAAIFANYVCLLLNAEQFYFENEG